MYEQKVGISLDSDQTTRLINYVKKVEIGHFAKVAVKEHEVIAKKLALALDHLCHGNILRDSFKPKKKVFLVHVVIHDGEHEHRDEALMLAKNAATAANLARKYIEGGRNKYHAGYFDYGDGLTECVIKHIEEITADEAEILQKYNICHFIN